MKDNGITTHVTYRQHRDNRIELIHISTHPTPKDNPITVKGNSRQEVVQGKRHSWPVSQKSKGHR